MFWEVLDYTISFKGKKKGRMRVKGFRKSLPKIASLACLLLKSFKVQKQELFTSPLTTQMNLERRPGPGRELSPEITAKSMG